MKKYRIIFECDLYWIQNEERMFFVKYWTYTPTHLSEQSYGSAGFKTFEDAEKRLKEIQQNDILSKKRIIKEYA